MNKTFQISIHALREEGDVDVNGFTHILVLFLSTPSARRATPTTKQTRAESLFLSTPSARRATLLSLILSSYTIDFYPRPPRGGRLPERRRQRRVFVHFYPRPPRGGRPSDIHCNFRNTQKFLSTPSARRATIEVSNSRNASADFYPRPPRGGRQVALMTYSTTKQFLSTPSARRATVNAYRENKRLIISIHALREEGDTPRPASASSTTYFYPRPPRGGRPAGQSCIAPAARDFYPRPPRGGRPSPPCWTTTP